MEKLPPLCIKNGASQICQELVRQSIGKENIVLNEPVSIISFLDTDQRKVYITSKTGQTYKCCQAIVALPPSLQREIEFSPPLEAKKKYLLSSMFMGSTIKFVLTYRETFWKGENFSGEFISHRGPISWLADTSYQNNVPTLTGFLAGQQAVTMSQLPENDLKVCILDQLSLIFGEWALEPTGFLIQNWFNDAKFIDGGPICLPAIGTMAFFANVRHSHGPIHFAGTESAAKFAGSMAGAVHAGHRAAIEVLDCLRPQCLTSQDYYFLKESQSKYKSSEDKEEALKANQSYSIYRWTIVLPSVAFLLAWTALRLRSTYGHLVVPKM